MAFIYRIRLIPLIGRLRKKHQKKIVSRGGTETQNIEMTNKGQLYMRGYMDIS